MVMFFNNRVNLGTALLTLPVVEEVFKSLTKAKGPIQQCINIPLQVKL